MKYEAPIVVTGFISVDLCCTMFQEHLPTLTVDIQSFCSSNTHCSANVLTLERCLNLTLQLDLPQGLVNVIPDILDTLKTTAEPHQVVLDAILSPLLWTLVPV